MRSQLLYSSMYHPQIDGKTKVVNRSLGNLLKNFSGENPSEWDLVLAQAKFSYNDSVNISIGKSNFHIVYGRSPKGLVDLIKLFKSFSTCMASSKFSSKVLISSLFTNMAMAVV